MKTAFTDEQSIAAPPEAVWTRLTDWSGATNWMPGVGSMRADGPLEVGTVLHFDARGKERTSTITAIEPGRALTMRSAVGGVTADYAYSIEPGATDGAGSRVRLDAAVATRGLVSLFAPMIRGAIAREDGVQLTRLKAWVEGESS